MDRKSGIIILIICLCCLALSPPQLHWSHPGGVTDSRAKTMFPGGAQQNVAGGEVGGYSPPAAFTSYLDFESCNSNCVDDLPALWSVQDATDGTIDCHSAAAKYAGSFGFAIELNDATAAYALAKYNNADSDNMSAGCWVYVPSTVDAAWDFDFITFSTNTYGRALMLKNGTGYGFRGRVTAGFSTNYIYVAPDNWYWVCAQYLRNSTLKIRVYSTSGVIQQTNDGVPLDEIELVTPDFTINEVHVGERYCNSIAEAGKYMYVDDIYVDLTATWPYVPASW